MKHPGLEDAPLADRNRDLPNALFLCHEQLLAHKLQSRSGRPGDLPVRHPSPGGQRSDRHDPLGDRGRPADDRPAGGPSAALFGSPLNLLPGPVLATAIRPAADGAAVMVRLHNPTGRPAEAHLRGRLLENGTALSQLAVRGAG
ncbi:MAG: hypothetical protein MZV63_47015 [Marinilabiliales bacterium]|nr:hypothetical protein [Marinilabiliales bacterium]